MGVREFRLRRIFARLPQTSKLDALCAQRTATNTMHAARRVHGVSFRTGISPSANIRSLAANKQARRALRGGATSIHPRPTFRKDGSLAILRSKWRHMPPRQAPAVRAAHSNEHHARGKARAWCEFPYGPPQNEKRHLFRGASFCGDPYGNRTHAFAVRGRRLSRLTNGPFLTTLLLYHIFF